MLPPRGNTPTKLIQEQQRRGAVDATLHDLVHRGRLHQGLGHGMAPGTPSVNGIYMRDGSYQEWLRCGQNCGTAAPLR